MGSDFYQRDRGLKMNKKKGDEQAVGHNDETDDEE